MKATLTDLRRNPGKIIKAIERNETVTLCRRGREIACIIPKKLEKNSCHTVRHTSIRDFPAVGIWKDRDDMKDPVEYVRNLRKGRFSNREIL